MTKINSATRKPKTTATTPMLQELGGVALLAPKGYAALALLSFTSSLLVVSPSQQPESPLWWLANAGALFCCWLWFELFSRVFFGNRATKPVRIAWIALFAITLGAIKGAATGALAAAFGLVPDLPDAVASRVVQTGFLGLLGVLALAALEVTLNRYQLERDFLVAERVELKMKLESHQVESKDLLEFVATTKSKLQQQASQAGELSKNQAVYARLIREIVETGLRPLSHRLWQREDAKLTNFKFADLTRVAIMGKQLAVASVSVLYFFSGLLTLAPHLGFIGASTRAALGATIIAAVLFASRLLRPKKLSVAWAYFAAVHLFAAVALTVICDFVLGQVASLDTSGIVLVVFIWLLETSFISSFVLAAMRNHGEVRQQLQEILSNPGIDVEARRARSLLAQRDLANYLHGSVQNRLLSAALRIESGGGNAADLVAELQAIEVLLEGAMSDFDSAHRNDEPLQVQLNELAGRWLGYVQIDFATALDQDFGADKNAQILQIANEAISNSVRHGLATKMTIGFERHAGGSLQITITDDGLGPRKGLAGLGSHLFNSLAGETWSMALRPEGGSVLTLKLA